MPERIQLRRTKGWRMPEGAVKVDRTTKWGNPFVKGERIEPSSPLWPWLTNPLQPAGMLNGLSSVRIASTAQTIDCYGWWLIQQPHLMASLPEIEGRDLACWCKPGAECHADVLLELANPPAPVEGDAEEGQQL